ncbi:MAG: pilus assembly protein [Myxococcaceae bacterium]
MTRTHRRCAQRGVTVIEVMATGVVLILGLLGAAMLVHSTSKQNRRTLTQTQAQLIAERELERISALGCQFDPPCANIQALAAAAPYSVWQRANGGILTAIPGAGDPPAREYSVAVDVDPPFEDGELGEPAVNRVLANGLTGNQINVRVAVTWKEPGDDQSRVYVLQTRMAP